MARFQPSAKVTQVMRRVGDGPDRLANETNNELEIRISVALLAALTLAWSTIQSESAAAFTTNSPLTMPRELPTATLLPDGRVLVVGGGTNSDNTTAELYDPPAGTWTPTAPMSSVRHEH